MPLSGQPRRFTCGNIAGDPSPAWRHAASAGKPGAAIACSLATRTASSARSASPWPLPGSLKPAGGRRDNKRGPVCLGDQGLADCVP